ncbi:MAG: tRNA lysidine(34) synthetase TilS [Polyangiaceae bacterium]
MSLLHVLAGLRASCGFRLAAHGVDHGLRPEAAAELDGAERLADELGVPFGRTRLRVGAGGNLQARARDARRAALLATAAELGAQRIATGHHADDRAETFLLRLFRGSGLRGLAVLPPRAGAFVRPFTNVRRKDLRKYAERHGLGAFDDPTNRATRFTRSRVRHELLPLLEALDPRFVEHVTDVVDELTAPKDGAEKVGDAVEAALVRALPAGLLPSRAHRLAASELVRRRSTRGRVLLPGGLVARFDRDHDGLVVESSTASTPGSGPRMRVAPTRRS